MYVMQHVHIYMCVCVCVCVCMCVLYVCILKFHAYNESLLEFYACILYIVFIVYIIFGNISLLLWQHIGHLL